MYAAFNVVPMEGTCTPNVAMVVVVVAVNETTTIVIVGTEVSDYKINIDGIVI